jgi:hypothetical protein
MTTTSPQELEPVLVLVLMPVLGWVSLPPYAILTFLTTSPHDLDPVHVQVQVPGRGPLPCQTIVSSMTTTSYFGRPTIEGNTERGASSRANPPCTFRPIIDHECLDLVTDFGSEVTIQLRTFQRDNPGSVMWVLATASL